MNNSQRHHKNSTSKTSFTISPAVSGKTVWDLAIDGPLTLTGGAWTITPKASTLVCSVVTTGGDGNPSWANSYKGGTGGTAYGSMIIPAGTYDVYAATSSSSFSIGGSPGGRNGWNLTYGSGGGGGYSGIKLGSTAIIIAGGGGGGAWGSAGGYGGGSNGGSGLDYVNYGGTGGGQSGGGLGGSYYLGYGTSTNGSQYQGGPGDYTADGAGGGGGGGWYGGGGGTGYGGGGTGGGGGSGYINTSYITGGLLTNGIQGGAGNAPATQGSVTLYVPSTSSSIEYLIVAGGGAGGYGKGAGGGGGGGVQYGSLSSLTPGSYSIVVGDGGVALIYNGPSPNGQNSSAFGITSLGGGGGASVNLAASSGGSGGGGSRYAAKGYGTSGQGYDGGVLAIASGNYYAGGGGGATSTGLAYGVGGTGLLTSSPANYYGGGGGCGQWYDQGVTDWQGYNGAGGSGGGGYGGGSGSGGSSGTPNTGGGGGGGGGYDNIDSSSWVGKGGSGGSGVVRIKYVTGTRSCTGGTITTYREFTIHTFTTSGTFVCA